MKLGGNQMCQCILIVLAIFLIYQIVCSCNKKTKDTNTAKTIVSSTKQNNIIYISGF